MIGYGADKPEKSHVVEVAGILAGVAVPGRAGYRFNATDARFALLDGSRFRRRAQMEAAALALLRAGTPRDPGRK